LALERQLGAQRTELELELRMLRLAQRTALLVQHIPQVRGPPLQRTPDGK